MKATLTSLFSRLFRRVLTLAPLAALLAAAPALAQDGFQPVNDAARIRTDPNPFIIGAYGFIWAALLVYVVFVARGLSRTRQNIEELRRRVDAVSKPPR
jgi:CcmD family protein